MREQAVRSKELLYLIEENCTFLNWAIAEGKPMHKKIIKTLPFALFMTCWTFNLVPAYSDTIKPTLDILHDDGQTIVSTGQIYPASQFTFTEITPVDTENLPANVIRYYDTNENNAQIRYIQVGLKSSEYGSGPNVKYYKWAKDDNGVKLVVTENPSESVLTLRYPTSVGKILQPVGEPALSVVNEIYVGQDIKNAIDSKGTINSITSNFLGNTLNVDNSDTFNYSAVLSEAGAEIKNISSTFVGNDITVNSHSTIYGTLVKVLGQGTIGELKSEFLGNKVNATTDLTGGLVQAMDGGSIGTIQSDFIMNRTESDSANIDGGIISNTGHSGIDSSRFISNTAYSGTGTVKGAVLHNHGVITDGIKNSIFADNVAATNSGRAMGGAIYNELGMEIVNSTFLGNHAIAQSGTAKGGAIYTDIDTTITANNGKKTEFTGNYVINNGVISNQAIYVANANGRKTLLTLNANGGDIILNDNIEGDNGFRTYFEGNDTGNVYIFGDIVNSNITAMNTNINLVNGEMKNYDWLSLNSDESANYHIDINLNNETADTFTLGTESNGTVKISNFNIIGGLPDVTKVIRILTAPDTISLTFDEDLIEQYTSETISEAHIVEDQVGAVTEWSDLLYRKNQKDIERRGLRAIKSVNERLYSDSLEYYVERSADVLSNELMGDTLKLVNQADLTDRTFTAEQVTDVYNVTDDLGSTAAGTITVQGIYNADMQRQSKLNAGDHTLFELDTAGTTLVLKNLDITSEKDADGAIINATASDSTVTFEGNSAINITGVEGTDGIISDGTLNINTDVNSNVGIKGSGDMNVTSALTLTDDASIEQDSITLTNNSTVTLTAGGTIKGNDGISIGEGSTLNVSASGVLGNIDNSGTTNLTAGTLTKQITGTGESYISGNLIVDHDANAELMNAIKLNTGSHLTANADDVGSIALADGVNGETVGVEFTGGTLNSALTLAMASVIDITGDVTYNAAVTGHNYIASGAKLTTNADNLLKSSADYYTATTVNEGGELHLTGGGPASITSYTMITNPGTIDGQGSVFIDGDMTTTSTISAKNLTIGDGVKLTAQGSAIKSENVTNDGTLYITRSSDVTPHALTANINGSGVVQTSGAFIMGNINQKLLVSGTTYVNAGRLNGEVENNSTLYLNYFVNNDTNGDHTLKTDITGSGSTRIYRSLNNNWVNPETGEIGVDFYTPVLVYNGASGQIFTTNADHLKGSELNVQSLVYAVLTGGTLNAKAKGDGYLRIAEGADVVSNAIISMTSRPIQVYNNAVLEMNADNLKSDVNLNAQGANKNGTLRLTGGTLNQTVDGETGSLEITGDVTSTANVNSILNITEDGTFRSAIEPLTNTINNDGKLYTYGELSKVINGSGTTYVDGTMTFVEGAGIADEGLLNLNNGLIYAELQYGTQYALGEATGEGNLNLYVNGNTNKAQQYILQDGSDGIFNLAEIGFDYGTHSTGSHVLQVLKFADGATGTAHLALAETIEKVVNCSSETKDNVMPDTYFDADYNRTVNRWKMHTTIGLETTDTANDSIRWTVNEIEDLAPEITEGDLLRDWNMLDSEGQEKFFRFRTANDVTRRVYNSPDKSAQGIHNILGVSETDADGNVNRSKIDLRYSIEQEFSRLAVDATKNKEGFTVDAGTIFNIKNVEFVNGYTNIIKGNGGKFGNIDENTHEVTGGIENTAFDNVNYRDNVALEDWNVGLVNLQNATISQIKDSSFSNNNFEFIRNDSAGDIRSTSGMLYLTDSTVGETYTDDAGVTQYAGGLINTHFDNNTFTHNGMSSNVYNYTSALRLVNSDISQMDGVTFKSNSASLTSSNAYASGMYSYNSNIGRMINMEVSGNTTGGSSGYAPGLYLAQNTTVGLIKDSVFRENSSNGTITSGGGPLSLHSYSRVNELDNVTFEDNIARKYGGAISVFTGASIGSIKNSTFTNNKNTTNTAYGGAIYLGCESGYTAPALILDSIEDTVFDGNYSYYVGGGAIYQGRLARIGDIKNVTFKNNYVNHALNGAGYGGAIYSNIASNSGTAIKNIINSTFENNIVLGTGDYITGRYGGAISISYSTIENILGTENSDGSITYTEFKNNGVTRSGAPAGLAETYGGAISISNAANYRGIGTIDKVKFSGNYVESTTNPGTGGQMPTFGGAIFANRQITKITNSIFENNRATTNTTAAGKASSANGGAIRLSGTYGVLGELSNTQFSGNYAQTVRGNAYGGAIAMTGASKITDFNNVSFENNSSISQYDNAYGGALNIDSASGTITSGIVNSTFKNNTTTSTDGYAMGGGIYTANNLVIKATGENGLTEFTGNTSTYNGNTYSDGIFVGGDGKTLTLQATNGGHILMNDDIRGTNSLVESVNPANEVWPFQIYNVTLNGDADSHISLFGDIVKGNVNSLNTNITTANNAIRDYHFNKWTSNKSAKWIIDADFANKIADNFTMDEASTGRVYIDNLNIMSESTDHVTVQILKALNDNIQLELNEDNLHIVHDTRSELGANVNDNEVFYQEAGYALSTTETTNDSITKFLDKDFDTLRIIGESRNHENRTFNFVTDDTYMLSEDLTPIASGTFTINGKEAGSEINANGHTLFNLNNTTTFVVNDTKITGAEDIINVNNATSQVVLNNAYIDGDINSGSEFIMEIGGDKRTTLNGVVTGANATTNASELVFNADTFKDSVRLDVQSGSILMSNNEVEDYEIAKLQSSNAAKYIIDMDVMAKAADNITVADTQSKGSVVIDAINYFNSSNHADDFKVQILKGNNSLLQLALGEHIQRADLGEINRNESDEIKETTNFNDQYYINVRAGHMWGDISLATTEHENDSLQMTMDRVWEESTIHVDSLGDTLKLVNEVEMNERVFESTDATDRYVLQDDLGETGAGTLSLNGVVDKENDNISTIDLNNHEGFVINEGSNLNITNVKLTGSDTDNIITVTDKDSSITLSGAVIDGNIIGDLEGNEKFELNLNGVETSTINGEVKNAAVTLERGGLSIDSDTFADSSNTVRADGGALYLNEGEIKNYNIVNLTSTDKSTYALDLDLNQRTSDTITANGSGVIVIDQFNVVDIMKNVDIEDEYIIQILKTETDSLQLKLSETVASQLDDDYHLGENRVILSTDQIQQVTMWDDELNQISQIYDVWGRLGLHKTDTENDSLKLHHLHIDKGQVKEGLGDTLKLVSRADIGDREFRFDDSSNVYHLGDNLDEVASGKLEINGVAGTDALGVKELSTLDMGKFYNGWNLTEETDLEISNVKITNMSSKDGSLAKVSSNATVNLNNVTVDNNNNSRYAIDNDGTVNMTGGEVILATGINGDGVTNVTGANAVMAGNSNLVQDEINVTSGSLYMTDGNIRGELTVGGSGSATVNVNGIDHAVSNAGQLTFKKDGTLHYNVTGDGTTNINGNIVNGSNIENDVKVLATGEFTTDRGAVEGTIDNANLLNLSGTLQDTITGSGTTKVNHSLNMFDGASIVGTLAANSGEINSVDDTISEFNIGTLSGDGNYAIDVDGETSTADKYVVGSGSVGTINITDINPHNFDTVTADFIAQVTSGSSNVQVSLSDAIKGTDYDLGRTSRLEEDVVKAITKYTDLYKDYERGGTLVGNLVEGKTVYEYDSIKMEIDESKTKWDGTRTELGLQGDTLALWNQLETSEDKKFVFDEVGTYTVGSAYDVTGVGETKGNNVTIQGVNDGENISTIDLNGKTGFEVKNATNFKLDNVKLTGNTTSLITVSNEDAKVILEDSYVDGNITGSEKYSMEITGDDLTTINGIVTNADAELKSGTLTFNTDTFSATNDSLTTTSNATVDLVNNTAGDEYVINKLTSNNNAKWNIDLKVNGKDDIISDTIRTVSGESAGKIVIDKFNITNGGFNTLPEDMIGREFIVQILKAQNNDIQLDLSDYVKNQIGNEDYLVARTDGGITVEEVQQHTQFDKDYMRTQTYHDSYGKIGLYTKDTTNDSLGIIVNDQHDIYVNEKIDDTLKLVNIANIDDRTFDFVTSDDVYQVSTDIGTTALGEMSVNGIYDSITGKRSTINGTDTSDTAHDLFELNGAQTLNLKNVKITGAKTVAELNDKDAVLNLNNVELSGNTSGIANNSGKVNMSGNNLISNNITGNGTTEVKSGETNFSGDTSITQKAINVTGGSLVMDDGSVNGELTVGASGSATVNVNGIDHAVSNAGQLTLKKDGTLQQEVTGLGTTNIQGNIVNGSNIENDVKVLATGEFTTDRGAVGGTIDNANVLNLSGTLQDTITGSGTTKVNHSLNMFDGASIVGTLAANSGEINSEDDTISEFNIGTLSGDGNYAIDVDGGTSTADKYVVGSGSVGTINITDINSHNFDTVTADFIAQVTSGSSAVQVSLSDAIKGTDYDLGRTSRLEEDVVKAITKYTDLYKDYERGGTLVGNLVEGKTVYEYDSIKMEIDESKTKWDGTRTELGLQGDTLALWNQLDTTEDKKFVFDEVATYTVGNEYDVTGVGETKGNNVTIKGANDGENISTIDLNGKTGFEVNGATTLAIENINLTNANSAEGSVIKVSANDADITLKNVNIENNSSTGSHGGAISTNSNIEIKTDNFASRISGNSTADGNEAIYLKGASKLTINTVNNGSITINDKIASEGGNVVAITGDNDESNVNLNNQIDNSKVVMDNVTLNLSNNNHFKNSDFTVNSGVINLINDTVQDQLANSFTVEGDLKVNVDVDLNNEKMDRLPENTVVNGGAFIHVNKMNLISDTVAKELAIPFAYNQFKSNVDYIGPEELSKETQVTTLFAPIYKYSVKYEERSDMGYFVFGRGDGASYKDYNPSIMASSVATQGAYFNQLNTLHEGFYHMERYTKYSRAARMAAENANKYAIAEGTPKWRRSPLAETSQAMWIKPYATFENIGFHNGPKVKNVAYGNYYGGDTDLVDMANGWKGILSGFIGYNGNHMSYDGVSSDLQGGALGVTGTFYKGNFFTGITASVGASSGEANTMYGTDHFTMLTTGIANKTGYNFEFKNGAIIIQPSLFTGYVMANNFDYTNSAKVKMDSDALHAIQIIPSVKVIGNTKKGWQPYASVSMVWNVMDKTNVTANDVRLPQISVKPYVEYGVGIQKSWSENFTAFGQAMIRDGGRNGIAMSFGLRWRIGKDHNKSNVKKVNTVKKYKNKKATTRVDEANTEAVLNVEKKQIKLSKTAQIN